MTGYSLIILIVAIVLITRLPKLRQWAREMSANSATVDGHRSGVGWYLTAWALSLGYGAWAVRLLWQSMPSRDLGWGGLVYVALAIPAFVIGMAIGLGGMMLLRRFGGPLAQLLVLAGAAGLLAIGFVGPIQHDRERDDRRRVAEDRAVFEKFLAESMATMEDVEHAPPGTVPEMLKVVRGRFNVEVTNLSDAPLKVSVLLVLPRGRQWERCWLGIEAQNCTPEAGGCSYTVGKDGSPEIARVTHLITKPELRAGQTRFFRENCGSRFATAPMEFRVTDKKTDRLIFQSDSGFVPDHPVLPH